MMLRDMSEAILVSLGAKIRFLRLARQWSQEELADNCLLHRTYIGGVERGERNISVVNLLKIAEALGLPIQDLFDFKKG